MRPPCFQDKGGRLADLDCSGGSPLSVPLCHHEQEGYRATAIHPRYLGVEDGRRGRLRWFQIGDSGHCEEIDARSSARAQRHTQSFYAKESKMIMLKRIIVGLLAIIICAIFLEIGERFEIPGVH